VTGVVRGWERFWFAQAPTSTLALVRIAFGLVMVGWTLSLVPDLTPLFSQGGLVPEQPRHLGWGLLRMFPSDEAVLGVWAGLLVSSLLVLVGLGTRLAAAMLFVCLLSLERRNVLVLNSGDLVLQHVALFLALSPAGASLSLARWLRARERFWELPPRAPWGLRLMQVQLSVIYFASVWAKVRGETWNDGTAVSYALRLEDLERFPVPDVFTTAPILANLFTYGTLAVELGVAILIWVPRVRLFAAAAGVFLHLAIDYAITVGFFSLAMLILYLAFLPPETASRFLHWVRGRLERSRLVVLRRLAAKTSGRDT
jgi:hypothetical protein